MIQSKHILYLLLVLVFSEQSGLNAQIIESIPSQRIDREILLQLENSSDLKILHDEVSKISNLNYQEELTKDGLIHSLIVNESSDRTELIHHLSQFNFVKYVSKNKRTKNRAVVPNDEKYYKQYNLQNMRMPELWCNGVSGVTSQGDTIVVAVIESSSTLISHIEINQNIWINHGEIANDGLDNDNNGYIDDYNGLNSNLNTGTDLDLGMATHGLGVMGVIGAIGDNNEGIAGMVWDVKILNVTNAISEIQAVKAYDYIYRLRKSYNESNGLEGTYIVATNSSFGIDKSFAEDEPIWCEQYDKLYSVGIINISASRNDDADIDSEGDIPSLCQSESLIAVSNITRTDLVEDSGYSLENIDLAAYGVSIHSLDSNDEITDDYTGTSFSAPHVSGLVALLYGQACDKLIDVSKNNPAEVVDLMKNFILDKALPIPSQAGRSVTGGKLNPVGTQELMYFYCDKPITDFGIVNVYYNSLEELVVDFTLSSPGKVKFGVYNMLGQEVFSKEEVFQIEDLWISNLELSKLPIGVYHLSIEKEGESDVKSFMVFG